MAAGKASRNERRGLGDSLIGSLVGRGGGWRALGIRLAIVAGFALALWLGAFLFIRGWSPPRSQYASQGVYVSAANGAIDWPQLAATGVDFAYIQATGGSAGRDARFEENMKGAEAAGIRYGVVHHFDLCRLSDDQATQFVTVVPRRAEAQPPPLALDFAGDCGDRPARAVVLSELGTLLSLIEKHSGKPALLRISRGFENMYQVSGAINRTVWLDGDFFPPDYAAKPWVMWTANSQTRIGGVDGPVDWLVVRSEAGRE